MPAMNASSIKNTLTLMALQPGDKAPDFLAKDQDGQPVHLADFRGKKLVLYFYPRDMTPGCTAEACSLRDNYRSLLKAGYEVLGSVPTMNGRTRSLSRRKNFPSDFWPIRIRTFIKQYGAWIEKSMYGRKYMGTARITYIIMNRNHRGDHWQSGHPDHADQILKNGPAKTAPIAKKTTPKKTGKLLSAKKKSRLHPDGLEPRPKGEEEIAPGGTSYLIIRLLRTYI